MDNLNLCGPEKTGRSAHNERNGNSTAFFSTTHPDHRFFRMSPFLFFVLILGSLSSCRYLKKETPPGISANRPEYESELVRDQDGNRYHVISIGKQVWFAENLKTTHYRNGDPIPDILDVNTWRNLTNGAFCNYDNDPSNAAVYGRLYNWYAVTDNRNICPAGWHVPTDADWYQLINYLGGESVAGGKLKESAPGHWLIPNTGATNVSGFTALPGGYRSSKGTYHILDTYTFYWTSTSYSDNVAWSWFLQNNSEGATRIENLKTFGFSVRCVKD